MPEMIQIVDENDQPIGSAPRAEAKAQGLRHRSVQIVLRDDEGNFLLQKRSEAKKTNPGKWTNAASGGVDPEEPYDVTAQRELFEEIGVQTPLTQLGSFKIDYIAEDQNIRQFIGVFEGQVPHDVPLTLQPEEVSEAKWMTADDLRTALAADEPAQFTQPCVATLRQFFFAG